MSMMLTDVDINYLAEKGISKEMFEEQLSRFKNGFPFIRVERAAVVSDGISVLEESDRKECIDVWRNYLTQNKMIVKFVPSSGAASRMFKSLYGFLAKEKNDLSDKDVAYFFDNLENFAFLSSLNSKCKRNEGIDAIDAVTTGEGKIPGRGQ